ncbi:MAG: tetratricopeptide repeat protein, partial [Candidatus Odinarchaeota archaeon]
MEKSTNIPDTDRLKLQILRSHVLTQIGEYDRGLKLAEQLIRDTESLENLLLEVDAHISFASALVASGKLNECLDAIENGKKMLTTVKDIQQFEIAERSATLNHITGIVHRKKGNLGLALAYLQQSLSIRKDLGNLHEIAESISIIGNINASKGNLDLALENFHESVAIFEELGDQPPISKLLNNIGFIYWQKGDFARALDNYHKSLGMFQKQGNNLHLAISLQNIGLLYWQKSDFNLALDYFKSSLALFEELNRKSEIGAVYNNIGNIYEDKGELDLALEYHQMSSTIRQELENKQELATSLNNIGHVHLSKGNFGIATEYFKKSLKLFEETRNNLDISHPLFNLVRVTIEKGSVEEARSYLTRLEMINSNEDNKLIDLFYRFAKAKVLKASDRIIQKAEAQQIFKQIVEEEVIKLNLSVDALINLCELLLLEFRNTGNEEILNELTILLNQLLEYAKTLNSHLWLVYLY